MAYSELEHTVLGSSTVVAAKDQVSADLAGEAVILNLVSGVYYSLDTVGTCIWDLIQEPRTVNQVRDVLLEEYEVEPDRCEREIVAFFEQLLDVGLIEIRDETSV
jgi:hypothetical protein